MQTQYCERLDEVTFAFLETELVVRVSILEVGRLLQLIEIAPCI
jgi:hypothetical protein